MELKSSNLYDRGTGNGRKVLLTFSVLIIVTIFVYYSEFNIHGFQDDIVINYFDLQTDNYTGKYLIYTSNCRIPNEDPFNNDVKDFFERESYFPCSEKPLLSYIEKTESSVSLHINQSLLEEYSKWKISCCYSNVSRIVERNKSDDEVEFSECSFFERSVPVASSVVMVKCKTFLNNEVYSNVHAIISRGLVEKNRRKNWTRASSAPPSVLIVGIDSVSKLNLIRSMPKTYEFFKNHDFIDLRGYTKIGDNTFPNVIAVLTGKSWTQVYQHCNPRINKMDSCNLIWDRFRQLGYVTAYAEDETYIATFNFGRLGFDRPPTDYYFRPYMIAAETLPSVIKHDMKFCTGPETSGERIMNLARDFQKTWMDTPKFGFFWMSTFSHNYLNHPSSMDDKVEFFLNDIYDHLDNTVLIFMSDHGIRFGDYRNTYAGWLEERLPFIYVHLPGSFKRRYPKAYSSILTNSKRLSCPFDLYMTLQEILYYASSSSVVESSLACPKCHSLFTPIEKSRTCADAAIEEHWCVCNLHTYVDPKRKIVVQAAEFVISEISNILKTSEEGKRCAHYNLNEIMSADLLKKRDETVHYLRVVFKTRPLAIFEATVETDMFKDVSFDFRLAGDISRIDKYGNNGGCVEGYLQKYCYCKNFILNALNL